MLRVVACLITLSCACAVLAADAVPLVKDTPEAACDVLKKHMAAVMALPDNEPDKHWFCDFSSEHNEYLYIIGLRYDPGEAGGSVPLVGWFAVARRSTLVIQYDVAEQRLVPIDRGYYGAAAASKAKGPSGNTKQKP